MLVSLKILSYLSTPSPNIYWAPQWARYDFEIWGQSCKQDKTLMHWRSFHSCVPLMALPSPPNLLSFFLRTSWNTTSSVEPSQTTSGKCNVFLHYAPSSILLISIIITYCLQNEDSHENCSLLWHNTWHKADTFVKFKWIHFYLIYQKINKIR